MRSWECAVVNTVNTKQNTKNTKKPRNNTKTTNHFYWSRTRHCHWKIFWITKKHKRPEKTQKTWTQNEHKITKTFKQRDKKILILITLLIRARHDRWDIFTKHKNSKIRKTQRTQKTPETTQKSQKNKTENKRAKRSTDEKGFKP